MSKNFDFDAIVIGGGAAGLSAAGIAANFGAKTLLIEQNRLGGDCTWTGCIPSKTLLKAGKVASQIKNAGRFGLIDQHTEINFKKVIEHVHQIRKQMYEDADRPEIYEEMGIEIVFGSAEFIDDRYVNIKLTDGSYRQVSSRYYFICAGSRAFIPAIPGIHDIPYLTNESLFEIDDLPEELIIVGGGPVGIEMSQAMNRLGARVTVIDVADRIMGNDDPELAGMLYEKLKGEGIEFILDAEVKKAEKDQRGIDVVVYSDSIERHIKGDKLLIATGRRANIEELGLDSAGVIYSGKGITVNDRCQTNQSHIYACGDITGRYQFTHMSDHMAKVAVTVALLKYPIKIDAGHVPWVTYTDPELAHLGKTEKQLEKEGTPYETYRLPYSKIDRAVTDSEAEGLIKIHARKWSGKIFGVDILGAHAGELISEYAVAMRNGVTLRNIADTIHPYPSYGLGARRAADQWYIKNQKEWIVKLIKKIFGYRGEVPDYSDPDRIV